MRGREFEPVVGRSYESPSFGGDTSAASFDTSGGASGLGGSSGAGGQSGLGTSGASSLAAGRMTDAAPGVQSGSAQSGAAARGGVAGAAGGMAGRGMGGGGMMGGAPGGRGQGSEDSEHKRKGLLQEDDPEGLFGADGRVVPPVIGE